MYNQALLEPYRYLEQTQGKGMRDLLIDAFNVWFKISDFELTKIKYIVRMLHNASLLYVQKKMRLMRFNVFLKARFHIGSHLHLLALQTRISVVITVIEMF